MVEGFESECKLRYKINVKTASYGSFIRCIVLVIRIGAMCGLKNGLINSPDTVIDGPIKRLVVCKGLL